MLEMSGCSLLTAWRVGEVESSRVGCLDVVLTERVLRWWERDFRDGMVGDGEKVRIGRERKQDGKKSRLEMKVICKDRKR
jgi:hypothetical protein